MPEDIIHTSALGFIRYGEKRSILSLKDFVMLTELTGYVHGCPIKGFQT